MYSIFSATGEKYLKSSGESLLELIGVILIFVVVLVACYLTTRFVASKSLKQKNAGNIEIMETYSVAQNRYLAIARVGTKYFLLGITKDDIHLLTELSEDEIVSSANSNTGTASFQDVFSSIKKKFKTGPENEKDSSDGL